MFLVIIKLRKNNIKVIRSPNFKPSKYPFFTDILPREKLPIKIDNPSIIILLILVIFIPIILK